MNQKTKKTDLYLINPKNISVQENFNSRRDFGDIEELAEQIATQGVLNPIHVRPIDGENNKFLLVDGERRYRAVMHNINNGVDIEYIPAIIVNTNDEQQLLCMQLQTNEGKNFDEYEYGILYSKLRKTGMSVEEMAKLVGKKIWHVTVCIAHTKRDPRVQELMKDERITGVDVRHIYQANKDNEEEAVRVILKLKEFADANNEHKICLKNLKKVKDIKLSDEIFDKTTIAMDTVAIKNGLSRLTYYMEKMTPEQQRNLKLSTLLDQLLNNKNLMIDEALGLKKVKKAE